MKQPFSTCIETGAQKTSGLKRRMAMIPSRIYVAFWMISLWSPLLCQTTQWNTNGSGTWYAPSGINVGIGTSTPAYGLDISVAGVTALRINGTPGNPNSNNTQLRFAGGTIGDLWAMGPDVATNNGSRDFTFWSLVGVGPVMTFQNSTGNVGIGTISPQHLLHVNGTIGAKEVIVSATGADYVFEPEYHLQPLAAIATYIEQHHHLPGIPSAAEVQHKGLGVGEMQVKLLAKIEELTLHMIEAEKRNSRLELQIRELQTKIAEK